MKKILMKILLITVTFMLLNCLCAFASSIYTGTCGANATYTFDWDNSILTINGTGSINGNKGSIGEGIQYFNIAETVIIGEGITDIANGTFKKFKNCTKLILPTTINTIGAEAFYQMVKITELIIPEETTKIGDNAFNGCSKITSLKISENVESIGSQAFWGCDSLKDVYIPHKVKTIGTKAFAGMDQLTTINVESSNLYYSADGKALFNKEKTRLIQYAKLNIASSYSIPNTVTAIDASSFSGSINLTQITVPSNIKKIENYTFEDCEKLNYIIIGSGVTDIGNRAFYNCTSLTNAIIPPSVTNIDTKAFYKAASTMVIKGKSGSYAQTFANANGYTFNALTTYTITYNANGGSNAPIAQPKFQGINTDLYMQEPTRANHKFLGWATSSTSKTIAYKPGATYSVNANITLYAVWENLYPTNVELSTYNVTLFVGDSENVYVTSITPTTAQNKALTWKSANTSIATVTDGTIKAISHGTTQITATTGDSKITKTVNVTVIKKANNIDFSLSETKQSPTSSNIKITIDGDKSLVKNIKWAYGSQNENYFTSNGATIDLTQLAITVDKNGIYTFCMADIDDNTKIKTINVSKIAIGQPQFTNNSGMLESKNELYIPINFDEIDENITVYMALYDNGKLSKLEKTLCVPSENAGKKEFRKTFNVVYPKKGYELKAFVWNENLMPYLNSINLKANTESTEQVVEGTIEAGDMAQPTFTINESKLYNIKSYIDNNAEIALYACLFDINDNFVAMDENDADSGFELNVNLEAGKTYKILLLNMNETASGSYMVVVK